MRGNVSASRGASKAGLLPFVPGAGQGPCSREHWKVGVKGVLVFPVSLVSAHGSDRCLSVCPNTSFKNETGVTFQCCG